MTTLPTTGGRAFGHAASAEPRSSSWIAVAPTLLATLAAGVMAGFFWSFSIVVMPALAAMVPLDALAAMQAINAAVRNAVFGVAFGGAILTSAFVIGRTLLRPRHAVRWLELTAALIYAVGAFGVTVMFNVPLNRMIEPLNATALENGPVMVGYIRDWTQWNHVRTLASLGSFALYAVALVLARPPRP